MTANAPEPPDEPSATLGELLYADAGDAGPSEQEWVRLVEAIGTGDQHALRALYERSHRLVFTLALRICGNREIAEELTIDVFHDVWRRAAEYEPRGGSVVGWIMMQARSRSIDRVRFEHRKKRRVAADATEPEAVDDGLARVIDARHRRSSLENALATLTADERRAIESAFFGELTYAEAAVQLDEPLGTVKTRVRSALAKLRKALASEGCR